ncbi:MAG: hypothetical protein ABL908_11840, partial [Hyphomicrobium sp.]
MADAKRVPNSGFGRAVDYIFGRNSLIGVAELMLLLIAGYATWHGMRDFIVGVSSAASQPEGGGLSISNDALVAAVCIVLTFLMWLALRETFGAGRTWRERLITAPLYIFLALWSIGFGYGFWWSLIAGEEATRTGLSGLQEDARDAGGAVAARLDAVRSQLDSVVSWSDSQMTREETSGGSCGIPSGAGRGPLYNARRSVRDSVTTLRDGMVRSWLEPVQADVQLLQQAASSADGASIEARQKQFEAKAAEIRGKARAIAARSNELGKSTAGEMRALAQSVSIAPNAAGFSCFDPTLGQRLKQAAEQADQPAVLKLRAAEFNEGPAGVANAIKKLWTNIGSYGYSLGAYVMSGGKSTGNAIASGEAIGGRDLIALLATIGIDLGLLAMAALNPPSAPPKRFGDREKRQIEDAIRTAVARAENADIEWVRRHFVYHNTASYLVIPNLYSCKPDDPVESSRGLAINQLAGVLDDMGIVRWPTKAEFKHLRKEEEVSSSTDLTEIRRKRLADLQKQGGIALDDAKAKDIAAHEPLRNHGLFS